ncbi:unnamed protein product [Echinostoma caproni]|uniref:Hyccin n=1 Tax=Echinostoma caproni TaxID=27848 RepID=A0A183BDQ8_9TREM|nr:unnamed protein product [Echinostoma caproni]
MPSKVARWLAAYKPASSEAMEDLTGWMYASVKLLEDMEEMFEKMSSSMIGEVCQRFVLFYRSVSVSLRQFVVFLLPSLIHAYLSHLCDEDALQTRKANATTTDNPQNPGITNLTALENCLLQICRHFLSHSSSSHLPVSSKSDPRLRLPTLSESSIYHDGISTNDHPTDENDIFPMQLFSLNVFNRVLVITQLLRNYLETLSQVDLLDPNKSLLALHSVAKYCRLCERVASVNKHPRLPSSSSVLCDFLVGLDMILYRLDEIDNRTDKIRRTTLTLRTNVWSAISEIEKRATYNCFSTPLLLAEAALHSRRAQYGPRAIGGFNISTSNTPCVDINSLIATADDQETLQSNQLPDTSKPGDMLRSMRSHHSSGVEVITNASFRPELVPEDITISDPKSKHTTRDKNVSNLVDVAHENHSPESKVSTVDNRTRVHGHNNKQQQHLKTVNKVAN